MLSLCSGATTRRFVGHTKDVLSVAFSADNRQIVSGSRDKTVKLWNTLGVCKYTIQVKCHKLHLLWCVVMVKVESIAKRLHFTFISQDESHTEWVSCVRFSPNSNNPIIVSCGWDKMVKVNFFLFFFLNFHLCFLYVREPLCDWFALWLKIFGMYYLTLDERIWINEGPTRVLLYSCFTFLFMLLTLFLHSGVEPG